MKLDPLTIGLSLLAVLFIAEMIRALRGRDADKRRIERLKAIKERMPDYLDVRAIDGDRRLLSPFRFHRYNGESFTVPANSVTDFASIPRLLWWWLPPHGTYERAAVVHDWLCTQRGHVDLDDGVYRKYSHREAADIFGEAMEALGIWAPRKWVMVFAVKRFGPKF